MERARHSMYARRSPRNNDLHVSNYFVVLYFVAVYTFWGGYT